MKTASLFMNGRSQAVRLPSEFRFEGKHIFIYRDKQTGNVILSSQAPPSSWQDFMALRDQLGPVPKDFSRTRTPNTEKQVTALRDPFADWSE